MKKIIISLLATLSILVFAAISVGAAPAAPASRTVGPFEGKFHGTIYGNEGSQAPISLNLTHRGNLVKGTVMIGEGLTIKGGRCGTVAVPASAVEASGQTSTTNRNQLSASSSFEVSGIDVTVLLDGTISRDGKTVNADAKIDLPWLCGGDPELTATLNKA